MNPPLRERSDLVWSTWLGTAAVTFCALEAVAYFTGRPQTLSRSLRKWMGIEPRSRRHYIAVGAATAGWLALLAHLETLHALDQPSRKGD